LAATDTSTARQRLDKWLWFARVVKTREAAQALVESGHVRLNGQKTLKPGHAVREGDVLTIVLNARVRLLRILDPGTRRGPAEAARRLYEERGMSEPHADTPQKQMQGPPELANEPFGIKNG
jgi:ribosome-associated heat shock protein Hsp15